MNAELLESQCRRAAPHLARTRTRFNDYAALLRLGLFEEAKQVLLDCRQVYEDERDIPSLGKVLGALADLEDVLGHARDAVRLGRDALRLGYVADIPQDIAVSHFNLANFLQRTGRDVAVVLAHRLASAVIRFQVGEGRLTKTLRAFARDLARHDGDPPLPGSFAELCQIVDQVDGVHFAQLFERLPKRAPDGEAALAEVLRLARELG